MKIKTQDLNDILKKLKVGVANKDIVEQSTHITFDGDHIFTFDGYLYIFFPFKTDFRCCVPANEFIKIISETDQEEIDMDYVQKDEEENGVLYLKGKSIKAALNTIQLDEKFTIDKNPKMKRLPKDFKDAIITCAFSASHDVSSHLNGICVNYGEVYGSDDLRISAYSLESEIEGRFLIPLSSVLALKDFDITQYSIEGCWVYFKNPDESILASRLLDEQLYKDPTEYFEFDGVRMRFPSDTKELVNKASILAEGEFDIDKKISVLIQDQQLTCKGSNKKGWIESCVKIKSNRSLEFDIHPQFFLQILDKTDFGIVGEDRILFKAGSFQHLMSLHERK